MYLMAVVTTPLPRFLTAAVTIRSPRYPTAVAMIRLLRFHMAAATIRSTAAVTTLSSSNFTIKGLRAALLQGAS